MASEILVKLGTSTTATMTSLNSLSTSTTTGGAQSAKIDLGGGTALLAQQYLVRVSATWTSSAAPTAGGPLEVYVGFSSSSTAGTGNTAGLAGADQGYSGYNSDVSFAKRQLTFVGVLSACNNTSAQAADVGTFSPLDRWAQIVIVNGASQSLHSTGNSVVVTPLKDEAQ